MAKAKALALLICFLLLLVLASAAEIIDSNNATVGEDLINKDDDIDNHKVNLYHHCYCYICRSEIGFNELPWRVQGNNDGKGKLKPSQCSGECRRRCSKTHHKKPCLFFCNKCCAKCLCVPPGTYGNKDTCPCYNNWKTKEGGPKCP
ncbi:unnamed protein product [Urochloa decumbens]|uniref:Uncharacterized protein n=1 Tax=Urochloa decumbens TaxID=240449 RepID=A0ABC9B4D6_9POAL